MFKALKFASTLVAMASNLRATAMASTLLAMASNLLAMASTLVAMASNLLAKKPDIITKLKLTINLPAARKAAKARKARRGNDQNQMEFHLARTSKSRSIAAPHATNVAKCTNLGALRSSHSRQFV